MDRHSFVFSLLLIVSVTTILGSVIKAKNPNGEELEALLKRSHDAHAKLKGEKSSRDKDSEMSKQIGLLRGPDKRKVTITITNEDAFQWRDPFIYKAFGTAPNTLKTPVNPEENGSFEASSTDDELLSGTSGVFTYYIPIIQKTLAVMWMSQPLLGNAWNVKLCNGDIKADQLEDIYWDLTQGVFAGDGLQYSKELDQGVACSGRMSDGVDAKFGINVYLV